MDGDPEMLRLARTYYKVGKLRDLELVESDALAFVQIMGMSTIWSWWIFAMSWTWPRRGRGALHPRPEEV
ncbi:MAG: hypothetical protein IPI95_13190 [Flavobacteriales bacterium]|nr:hypothetical protein [Flavobacteriales bacterium]